MNIVKEVQELKRKVNKLYCTLTNSGNGGGGSNISRTSELINDGENGEDKFITAKDIPDIEIPPLDYIPLAGTEEGKHLTGRIEAGYVDNTDPSMVNHTFSYKPRIYPQPIIMGEYKMYFSNLIGIEDKETQVVKSGILVNYVPSYAGYTGNSISMAIGENGLDSEPDLLLSLIKSTFGTSYIDYSGQELYLEGGVPYVLVQSTDINAGGIVGQFDYRDKYVSNSYVQHGWVVDYVADNIPELVSVSATVSGIVNNTPLQELGGQDKLINTIRIGQGLVKAKENLVVGSTTNLGKITTGTNNTVVGKTSGTEMTTGYGNVLYGKDAGQALTVGYENTYLGSYAGKAWKTGSWNTLVGEGAAMNTVDGLWNTVLGCGAMMYTYNRAFMNTVVGANAMRRGEGKFNTYLGFGSGQRVTGENNVFIGNLAGSYAHNSTNTSLSNKLIIQSDLYLDNGSNGGIGNQGTPSGTNALIYGDFQEKWLRVINKLGIGVIPTEALEVVGNIKADTFKLNPISSIITSPSTLHTDGTNVKYTGNDGVPRTLAFANQPVMTLTVNTTLSSIHNNMILRVTNSITVTIPTGLTTDFNCVFDAIGNTIVTFVFASGVTYSAPTGLILSNNNMCNLYCTGGVNIFRLNGGLIETYTELLTQTISADTTLSDAWHGAYVRITGNCIITIPLGLRNDFECFFDVIGDFTAQFVFTAGIVHTAPYGKFLKQDCTAMLKMFSLNNGRLTGDLLTS